MPRVLGGSQGGGRFLMGEVTLQGGFPRAMSSAPSDFDVYWGTSLIRNTLPGPYSRTIPRVIWWS